MDIHIKRALIHVIRKALSGNKLSGFSARAHLLFLGYLRGWQYAKVEPRIDQSTYHRYHYTTFATNILNAVKKNSVAAALLLDPLWSNVDLKAWPRWCQDSSMVVKAVKPRVKKIRPNNRDKKVSEDAAE